VETTACFFMKESMSPSPQPIAEINCERSLQLRGDGSQPLPDEILASTVPLVLRGLVADWPLARAARNSAREADAYPLLPRRHRAGHARHARNRRAHFLQRRPERL
jgi:hypothetical protein